MILIESFEQFSISKVWRQSYFDFLGVTCNVRGIKQSLHIRKKSRVDFAGIATADKLGKQLLKPPFLNGKCFSLVQK